MREVISVKCSGAYILMWWNFGELTLPAEVDLSSNIFWSLPARNFPAT
jgi:hypothetical protein